MYSFGHLSTCSGQLKAPSIDNTFPHIPLTSVYPQVFRCSTTTHHTTEDHSTSHTSSDHTTPQKIIPHLMPHQTSLYHLTHQTSPHQTTPHRTTLHTTPILAMPHQITLHHITHHTTPYNATPGRTRARHTTHSCTSMFFRKKKKIITHTIHHQKNSHRNLTSLDSISLLCLLPPLPLPHP